MLLITGATGFLGSHLLLQSMRKKLPVIATYYQEQSKNKTFQLFKYFNEENLYHKIVWRNLELGKIDTISTALEDVDLVIHCAAEVNLQGDPYNLNKTNEVGTSNLINVCINKGIPKLIHIGSISVLPSPNAENKEDYFDDIKNMSGYGFSKMRAELNVWRGAQEGLQTMVLNPAVIVGAGNTLLKRALQTSAKLKYIPNGFVSYVSVHDVVNAVILAIDQFSAGKRYTISHESLSLNDLNSLFPFSKMKWREIGPKWSWFGKSMVPIFNLFRKKERQINHKSVDVLFRKNDYYDPKITEELGLKYTDIKTPLKEMFTFEFT